MQERHSEREAGQGDQAARRLRRRLLSVIGAACLILPAVYVVSTVSFKHSILEPIPGAYVAPQANASMFNECVASTG